MALSKEAIQPTLTAKDVSAQDVKLPLLPESSPTLISDAHLIPVGRRTSGAAAQREAQRIYNGTLRGPQHGGRFAVRV